MLLHMKKIHLLPLALILPILIVLATPADASRGDYRAYLEKSSFEYGEPFQYTITFSGLHDPNVNYIKTRVINKATGMASEWSNITLEGQETTVTTDIIEDPFDKKGTYILQTIYNPPKLFSYGGGEFELLDDADPETSQGKTHFLSIAEQFNAQIPASEIVCKQGLELVERSRNAGLPVCIKPETKVELLKRGFVHDRSQDPEGLVFDGFDTYSESVPLDFAIWFKGNANTLCFTPKITVTDSTGQGIWSNEDPHDLCDTDEPKYIESIDRINTNSHDYPILSVGKYTITAQFENHEISKEIIVK